MTSTETIIQICAAIPDMQEVINTYREAGLTDDQIIARLKVIIQ